MDQKNNFPPSEAAMLAAFRLLGAEERVMLLIGTDGRVLWQTSAAERLLQLDWHTPVMAVLSENAACAVETALRESLWLEIEEEIDEIPYLLRTHPTEDGLLLLAESCAEERRPQRYERALSIRGANILGGMTNTVQRGLEHAQEETERALWERMEKLVLRARRIQLHSEIIDGEPRLDERMVLLDLAGLCRELIGEAQDLLGVPVTAPAGPLEAVMSREAFTFVLLNLLANAAACRPGQIEVGLRRANGHIYLQVSDDAAALEMSRVGEVLGGWRSSAAGTGASALTQVGTGLPAVERLLGRWGGSLLADADGSRTRFIAVFPDDLPADPPMFFQTEVSSGIEDLVKLELSVL
ncbi:MAG: sensor histidine kinase [Butyricicoccus sp.]|nr:sensor histidine kinase [Butyricicoccus sp.]